MRRSGTDRIWEELRNLIDNNAEMTNVEGHRRKLIIFTEHRDTLNYLVDQLCSLPTGSEAVGFLTCKIDGGLIGLRKKL